MLGAALGSGGQTGGLNTLYQIGGPRPPQLTLLAITSAPMRWLTNLLTAEAHLAKANKQC
jgi:hypothetical protein